MSDKKTFDRMFDQLDEGESWKIVPAHCGCVRLVVRHNCGHVSGYTYAAEEFAKPEIERFQSVDCLDCRYGWMERKGKEDGN